ncbi:putative zinc finger, RING/FYVE/PHD-type containing protein, partial [Tanacetum coccineum]
SDSSGALAFNHLPNSQIAVTSVAVAQLHGKRASFGTEKYCHAWLRNTPCNNVVCLDLHSIGAEEDSFGKDEIAAVLTRNRVQEIIGAAQYLHKHSEVLYHSCRMITSIASMLLCFEEPVLT